MAPDGRTERQTDEERTDMDKLYPPPNPSAISGGYFIFFFWGGGGRGDGGGGGEKEGARVRDFFLLRIQI